MTRVEAALAEALIDVLPLTVVALLTYVAYLAGRKLGFRAGVMHQSRANVVQAIGRARAARGVAKAPVPQQREADE